MKLSFSHLLVILSIALSVAAAPVIEPIRDRARIVDRALVIDVCGVSIAAVFHLLMLKFKFTEKHAVASNLIAIDGHEN